LRREREEKEEEEKWGGTGLRKTEKCKDLSLEI